MGYTIHLKRERPAFTDEAANAALRGAVNDLHAFYDDVAGAGESVTNDDMRLTLLLALEKAAERVVLETVA